MRGFAVVDIQPGANAAAIWVVAQASPQRAANVNAVTIDLHGDPEASRKLLSLTRNQVVVLTDGSDASALRLANKPLAVDDIEDLVRETEGYQQRIIEAVEAYARASRSKTLVPPVFESSPNRSDFIPSEDTATQRAFQSANFLNRVWSAWLNTDEQRRRRSIHPKTNDAPWIMPEEMSSPTLAMLPPDFAARVQPEPVV